MEIFIYIVIIAAIGFILGGVFSSPRYRGIRLPEAQAQVKKSSLPSFLSSIFPFSPALLKKLKLDIKLSRKLQAAHLRLSAPAFFNLKLLLIIFLSMLSYFALGKFEPGALALCLGLGYIIPGIWLNKKINQRKEMIVKILPETVDLLGLCVEAGLDFTMALKWVIEKTPHNPLLEELTFVLEEIKWGQPRTKALRNMSIRLGIPEVSSFVQTLVLAERMGTPVAEAFNILSEDTRLQRFHRGERFAMRAPIKILIPLIFCILPVIAIIIGAPIFLQFMQRSLF